MRTLKLTVAYDGTRFVGWQRQAEGESIQGLLEDALARFEGAPVTVYGAGRTDAGVHALGQVASARVTFSHPATTVTKALNAQLPDDIRVIDVSEAPPDFHARHSARSKTYHYRICSGEIASPFTRTVVWHLTERLDLSAMREAAAAIVGTHDFAAFQSTGTPVANTMRTIFRSEFMSLPCTDACAPSWTPENGGRAAGGFACECLTYEVSGNGFLRHMVRAVVGTLVEVGRGWRPVSDMAALLAGGTRGNAGATAPPHGLVLVRVDYD